MNHIKYLLVTLYVYKWYMFILSKHIKENITDLYNGTISQNIFIDFFRKPIHSTIQVIREKNKLAESKAV